MILPSSKTLSYGVGNSFLVQVKSMEVVLWLKDSDNSLLFHVCKLMFSDCKVNKCLNYFQILWSP